MSWLIQKNILSQHFVKGEIRTDQQDHPFLLMSLDGILYRELDMLIQECLHAYTSDKEIPSQCAECRLRPVMKHIASRGSRSAMYPPSYPWSLVIDHPVCVRLLLEYTDLEQSNVECHLAHQIIKRSMTEQHVETLRILLERDWNVYLRDVNGVSAWESAYDCDTGLISRHFVEATWILVRHNVHFVREMSPYALCVDPLFEGILQYALENHFDANDAEYVTKFDSLLFYPIQIRCFFRTEPMKLLLTYGADPNTETHTGRLTPLFFAPSREAVTFLLRHGANLHHQDAWKRTALFTVSHTDVARELIRQGLHPLHQHRSGSTPLMNHLTSCSLHFPNRQLVEYMATFGGWYMYRSSGLCPAEVTYNDLNQHMRREFTPHEWETFVKDSVASERKRTEHLIARALPRFPTELVLYIADFLVKKKQ